EAPVAGEPAGGEAGIAGHRVDRPGASRVAARLLDLLDAAKCVDGVLPGRLRRDARGAQALGFAVDVLLQFLAQLRLPPSAEQQGGRARADDVPEPHVVS